MADNTADTVAKASAVNTDDKAPKTNDNLPPIAKEPAATAEASMMPSVPAEPGTADAPGASSSDAATKLEVPATGAVQEDPVKKMGKANILASQPEEPSNPAPAPAPAPVDQPTTDTVASDASAHPNGEVVEPPKPVSIEEIRDQDLPDAKPPKTNKSAGDALDPDAEAPIVTTGVETTEVSTVDSASAEKSDTATGDKRKAGVAAKSKVGETKGAKDDDTEPAEKKQKTNGAATNGAARKPGRPKKEKKAAMPVGRTMRKTRSQGAADSL
ncbi:hypothetical protein F5Y19DRAFT_47967 [Xylariaceae sp. FL1651]|nr:hypothetical protein F5Y19DRAFT_47967 [Xylariaceae sp. FL1651]